MNFILKKIKKIYESILYLNIFLLNVFVGSIHDSPRTILQTIIIFEAIVYIIIAKFQKKRNILIKGKIDVLVLAMMGITIIPLIFKTYCSLNDTIEIFIEYLTIYSIYIITRNVIITEKEKRNFLNIILLSSILIIIFGIDRLNFNIFQKFYDMINASQVKDWRMTSIVGYSNAVFTYIVSLMVIALGMYLNSDNRKLSAFYITYIQLAMYAFYYCNSRAGMIIFALIYIIFLFKMKDTKNVIRSIIVVVISYILVVTFDMINNIYKSNLTIILGILLTIIISYIFNNILVIKALSKVKIKNGKKYVSISIVFLCIIFFTYFIVAKNFSKPFDLKEWNDSITIYDFKSNTKYKTSLDLISDKNESVKIQVFQINNKRDSEKIYEKLYTPNDGKISEEFEFETKDENIDNITIKFITKTDNRLIFNKMYINNKEKIVNYKYLPNSIMRLVKTLRFNNISITERLSMYKSGFELFWVHPLIGNGARTFENLFQKVREYNYTTMEIHSFYMDILIDYGLIGILVFMTIIIITIFNYRKGENKDNIINLAIFFGWMLVVIHTAFDFDLAYMLTLSNFYIMIAIINNQNKEMKKNTNIVEYIVLFIMIIIFGLNIYKIIGESLYKKGEYEKALKYLNYSEKNMSAYIEKNEYSEEYDIVEKVLIKYLNNEKNRTQYSKIKSLYRISMRLIEENKVDEGIEGINEIIDLIKRNEVIAKDDIFTKDEWNNFFRNMKANIRELESKVNNEKIEEINEKIQNLN